MKNCQQCQTAFTVSDHDREFYAMVSPAIQVKKFPIPDPTFCPDCRHQRRQAWRNERTLYKRTCDFSGKPIISVFSPEKPFKVYGNEIWFSDQWDCFQYGRKFDFSRPFFDQFEELMKAVPQLARSATGNYNSDYVNQFAWSKNCYLCFEGDYCEDCLYSNYIYDSKSCLDCLQVQGCELCYECIDCRRCYQSRYCQDCENCSDSWFLLSCIGCQNCFGSANLRNKQYYFFNEKLSKEEYEKKIRVFELNTRSGIERAKKLVEQHWKKFPRKYQHGTQNEDSTGDYLWNTQRCQACYDIQESQDCAHVTNSRYMKNVHDTTVFGSQKGAEYCFENHEIGDSVRNILFSDQVWTGCSSVTYSKLCVENCHHLFGCVGLRHSSYVIFNKRYSKKDYEVLCGKLIEHMQKTGEWGQFFPARLSPFGYNETVASEYYPLSKEEALQKGFRWSDFEASQPDVKQSLPGSRLPENVETIPDDILSYAIECASTKKLFRVVAQELSFYRQQKLPVPVFHPDERHRQRMLKRNPRRLHEEVCAKCQVLIMTSYSPNQGVKIYCEKCYSQNVYG